ncbi:HlyD family type I secretion periplasmic adaptor subunit [Chelatococcus sp. SYSU_G07232]|uniref:Membrane fusion protein (MFP) family protein n=1 Tax=Chelatococcus albus TaxID=3047466 RepID=A0ABT7AFD4_9HYPH|nr:HlyD family type I secretion periplasmic adaptor subunit [Chelatococcus sp. SYSU_G07232]MDJ1157717.1 HlyD family type I secretion periplasmic adaptor subunit [Chelatococcus sp. SYSU_G07232]
MDKALIIGGEWYADVPRSTRVPVAIGLFALVFGLAGFGIWASLAPIDGAVVAPGTFVATGQNKIIQHLEGGIISEILVREGDVVEPGAPLVRLDPTDPQANLRRLSLRNDRLMAMQARLRSEIDGRTDVVFPAGLVGRAADGEVAAIIAGQRDEFVARRERALSEVAILEQGIAALREGIAGSQAQLRAVGLQLELVEQELAGKLELLKKGYVRKPDVLALERARAGLEGQIGQLTAAISDAKERIAREQQKITHVRSQLVQSATEQLRSTEAELDDVRERLRTAENVRGRVSINAPVKGIVVKMMVHTPGGVIAPGKDILELLPINDELIIEARVRPQDIDRLHQGQDALVRLTALNQRVTPMLPGRLVYVSADALPDDRAGRAAPTSAYVARIALDKAEAAKLPGFRATPGMPAEIFIRTGERTFFSYLLKPLVDSFTRAFRER